MSGVFFAALLLAAVLWALTYNFSPDGVCKRVNEVFLVIAIMLFFATIVSVVIEITHNSNKPAAVRDVDDIGEELRSEYERFPDKTNWGAFPEGDGR